MDKSILTTLKEFEENFLWPETNGDMPKPTQKAIDTMTGVVHKLFYTENGKRRPDVSEDAIAQAIVYGVVNNDTVFPGELQAALSQNRHQSTNSSKSKVDAALYPLHAVPEDGSPDWTRLRLLIEFKKGGVANDPFDDQSDHPEAKASSRAEVRGHLLAYASATFQFQHRTRLYSLLVNGEEFRAMYWDRSELVVSMATNYVDDPAAFLRFLWAFANLDDTQQGLDPTATLLSEDSDEYELMDAWAIANPAFDMPFHEGDDISRFVDPALEAEVMPPVDSTMTTRRKERLRALLAPDPAHPPQPVFKYVRDGFRASLEDGWPRYKLLVGESERAFLVGKPVFTATSMFGRGTRAYIALDVEAKRFVFLKDSWRPFYEGVDPEGTYLKTMASKPDIKLTIPTVVEHGDVLKQTTFGAEYSMAQRTQAGDAPSTTSVSQPASGRKRPREEDSEEQAQEHELRLFIHYRIAVEEVCLDMGNFTSGKQLVRLILECITTHRDAYEQFNILHRDISAGNMLIWPMIQKGRRGKVRLTWRGLLTDWELAKCVPKGNVPQRARQPERTGTWQFMSVAYVRYPERPVVVADELESFFHVILHHAVRYLRHSYSSTGGTTSFITHYFDNFVPQNNNPDSTRCSALKINAVTQGIISIDEKRLLFVNKNGVPQHPLNNLFRRWLKLPVARYCLLQEEETALSTAQWQAAQSGEDTGSAEAAADGSDSDFSDIEDTDSDDESDGDSSDDDQVTVVSSDKTKSRAAALGDHSKTIRMFKRYLRNAVWPADDVVGDQLVDYNPKRHVGLMKSLVGSNAPAGRISTSSKKARLDSGAGVASGSVPAAKFTLTAKGKRQSTKSKFSMKRQRHRN